MSPVVHRIAFAFLFVTSLPMAMAATTAQIDAARAKGLWWLITHQNGDGRWKNVGGMEVQSTAAAVEAMTNAGVKKGNSYGAAVAWLKNADAPSVDALSRKITALSGVGVNEKTDLDLLLSWKNTPAGSYGLWASYWGAYSQFTTSFPDTPLAFGAIRAGQYTYTNQTNDLANAVYCAILPAQKTDGSWSYFKSQASLPTAPPASPGNILSTAYTVFELQAIRTATGWDAISCGTSYSLVTGINNGISWLLTQKNPDNGFGANGQSTVLETVLAYRALNAVQPANAAIGPALDYLISKQDSVGGSWQNDPLQTGLVLKAFPATVMTDSNNDGIPDAVASLMGNPDARSLVVGNGQSVPGVTIPAVLASTAYLNQPFSISLTAPAGTSPFAWAITTGGLPPGLSLSSTTGSTVSISGAPTAVGNYNFAYTVTDATGASSATIAQIDVLRAPSAPADGDLNGDGVVDVADVALAERIALGLVAPTALQMSHGDVAPAGSPDGVVDAADVARIRRKALGLEAF